MKELIQSILDRREDEVKTKEAERRERLDREIEKQLDQLKNRFGDFWKIIEASGAEPEAIISRDRIDRIVIDIPALDDLELAPIRINTSSGWIFTIAGKYSADNHLDALAIARKRYPEYKEELKAEGIDRLVKELHYYSGTKEEKEAVAIFDRLIELAPDRSQEWNELLQRWTQHRADQAEGEIRKAAEKAEREAQELKRAGLRTQYTAELESWLRKYEEIQLSNDSRWKGIQELADREVYRAYKLTYAIVAFSEEGEQEIETRFVWTRQEKANDQGYWMVDGNAFRPFNLVSIEGFDFKPSEGPISKKIRKAGFVFYFAPYIYEKAISDRLDDIQELPEKPEAPAGLEWHDEDLCLKAARRNINGPAEDF